MRWRPTGQQAPSRRCSRSPECRGDRSPQRSCRSRPVGCSLASSGSGGAGRRSRKTVSTTAVAQSPKSSGGTVVGLNQSRVTSSPRCQTNPRSMGGHLRRFAELTQHKVFNFRHGLTKISSIRANAGASSNHFEGFVSWRCPAEPAASRKQKARRKLVMAAPAYGIWCWRSCFPMPNYLLRSAISCASSPLANARPAALALRTSGIASGRATPRAGRFGPLPIGGFDPQLRAAPPLKPSTAPRWRSTLDIALRLPVLAERWSYMNSRGAETTPTHHRRARDRRRRADALRPRKRDSSSACHVSFRRGTCQRTGRNIRRRDTGCADRLISGLAASHRSPAGA